MKKLFFIVIMTVLSFQISYADIIESCRLEKVDIQAEDGRHGGIEVGMVLENGLVVSVSDDIQIKQHSVNELSQILSQTKLKSVVDSLHLSLENVSAVQILKIASDAIVIRLMDENGNILAKVGQTQNTIGVCEAENQSSSQTPD